MIAKMFGRKRHYRDGEWCPRPPHPHREALIAKVDRVLRVDYSHKPEFWEFKTDALGAKRPLTVVKKMHKKAVARYTDRQTWTGRVWALRETEMDARQRKIDLWIKEQRPVLSLTNLDPYKPYMDRTSMLGRYIEAMYRSLGGREWRS